MDLTLIFRLSGIGFLVAVLNFLLSKIGREDIGLMVSVVGLIICMLLVVNAAGELLNTVTDVFMLN
ncbi:MAG: stage III sporulation protein AC [Clostridia bacterium]|nr:stage III sporulation protein AC [Clostridia bacterium]